MALLLSLLLLFCIPVMGVALVRKLDQIHKDKDRKTYRLSFPSDLDEDRVVAWLRSISGTLRPRAFRFDGAPTVAFEVTVSSSGIEHRLRVPWQHADYVIAQLRTHVPGLRYAEDKSRPHYYYTRAVEVGLTRSDRQLRIFSASDMSASLLASMAALEEGEVVLVQWVITPAVPKAAPIYKTATTTSSNAAVFLNGNMANRDEVKDRREKLEEPNVLGVLRVAAVAGTDIRADHLINRIKSALTAARSPTTRFVKRLVTKQALQTRVELASAAQVFPTQLSVRELVALIAWPLGNPMVAGLPPAMSRQIPVTENVPREGRVIGRSNFPGNERPIALSYTDALRHMHVMGPTGSGKTVLLANLMRQDMAAGYGVILIENKGDLYKSALDYVPKERLEDVILLDVQDFQRPLGFNILGQGDPRVVIDELGALFEAMFDSKSVWTREVLYHGLRTMITDPKLTFIDLAALLVPMTTEEEAWRDALLRSLKDKELRQFWQRFQNQPRASQDRIAAPLMDRIWQLNARPELRNIIGQSESSFQMTDVIAHNKVLLVNLKGLPPDSASLFGTLMMNSVWQAAKTTRGERNTYLYLDEFQDFLRLPIDPQDMLAKARGFGLGMVLAHQHLGQLSSSMSGALSANARSKIVFQTESDSTVMARQFGRMVTPADFEHLSPYEAIARTALEGGVSPPMTMTAYAPAKGFGLTDKAIFASRERYGRSAFDVERSIEERRMPDKAPKTVRPKLSGTWGEQGA